MLQKADRKMSKEGIAITVLLDGDNEDEPDAQESLSRVSWDLFTCIMAAGGSMGAAGVALYFTQ